jgi:mitochondrial fission protein ELM1
MDALTTGTDPAGQALPVPGRSPQVWVLADDRPGNVNQALGVAEALGWPFEVKQIRYGQLARLPNWMLPPSIAGLTQESRERLAPPYPDLVLGAGRRMAPVARWLKLQKPDLRLAQLMWPGSAEGFDLIAMPEHDRLPDHPVVIRTIGAPHRLKPALLAREAAKVAPLLNGLPRPLIACLVGGTSRHAAFTPADARELAKEASALAEARGGSLLVTTSRRTGRICADALAANLTGPHRFHRWMAGGDNPYLGFLGSADGVIVTCDSASMCTEACALGRPVFLFRPKSGAPVKFRPLYRRFEALGCLKRLGEPWFEVEARPPDPTDQVAAAIRRLFASPERPLLADTVVAAPAKT